MNPLTCTRLSESQFVKDFIFIYSYYSHIFSRPLFPPWNPTIDYSKPLHVYSLPLLGCAVDPMLADYSRTFHLTLILHGGGFTPKTLSDIEGCSSRPCQMRSALTIMGRSSGGAASRLHNSPTASVILCPVSIKRRDQRRVLFCTLQTHT